MPPQNINYGASSKFGFNDPSKWYTLPSVPLLDEHELTNDAGRPIATVDRAALQEIANNGNRKIVETGDPATLILGHTSDDPRAPEKPSVGFLTNLQVKPFKRTADGKVVYALHGDFKLRPNKAHLVEDYPRRSVELWWAKKDVDPVALLGGSAPERDLGAVIRKGRLNHVALETTPVPTALRNGTRREDPDLIKFHRRGEWVIENYGIAAPTRYEKGATVPAPSSNGKGKFGMPTSKPPSTKPKPGPVKMECEDDDRLRYEDDGMDTEDLGGDYDGGDDAVPTDDHGTTDASAYDDNDGGDETGSMSPAVAELLQSKQFRQMQDQLATISTFIESLGGGAGAGGAGMDAPGGDPGAGEMPPPGGPGGGAPMGGPPGGGMPPDAEESRRGMGERPVQMGAGEDMGGTGFPGQSDGYVPGMDSAGKNKTRRMSRGGTTPRGTPMTATERRLQEEVTRLSRRDRENRLMYAQSEAAKRVDALVNEGYLFGQNPAEHAEGVDETKKHFATLLFNAPNAQEGIADVGYEEDIIRRRYSRRKSDPSRVNVADISRLSRNPHTGKGTSPGAGAGDGEDFEPVTDEEACEFADLVGVRKMSRKDAGTVMLRRRNAR